MQKVAVIGAGGFGREVLEIFKDDNRINQKWEIMGFLDGNEEIHGTQINGYPVLGCLDWLADNPDVGCVVAIGDPKTKKAVIDEMENRNAKFVNAIHPSVVMSEFVKLGKNVIICAGCILTVDIVIHDHVILNINSTVGHDTIIENYCSIMPAVNINGNNQLNEGVYVGTGATFIQEVSVGSWTTIGAGAVIVKDIPENVVAVGMPAKAIKKLSD